MARGWTRGAAMAWKDSDAGVVPKLDFSQPRVVAAMLITGLQETDLKASPVSLRLSPNVGRFALTDRPGEKDENAPGLSTARSETLARSKDMWERKQRQLLRELEATADALDESEVDNILRPLGRETKEGLHNYAERKAQVERMRERLAAQLRRDAQRQINGSSAQEAAAKERESLEKRLREDELQRKALLLAEAQKQADRRAKVQERLKQELRQLKARRDEITSKLQRGDEHVHKAVEDKEGAAQGRFQEVRSRVAAIAERRMTDEQADLEAKARRYEEALRHEAEVEDRLNQVRLEVKAKLEERRLRLAGRSERVAETHSQQDRKKDSLFVERAKKVDVARKLAAAKSQEKVDSVKAAQEKQHAKWLTNRQNQRKERKEHIAKLTQHIAEHMDKATEGRDRYHEELVFTRSANRGMLLDFVEQNKARIERSDECARKQTLAKVERELAKKETAITQIEGLQAYRLQVTREAMLGRTKVEELKRIGTTAGVASTKRVNEILKELAMPPLASTTFSKEGDHGEEK